MNFQLRGGFGTVLKELRVEEINRPVSVLLDVGHPRLHQGELRPGLRRPAP